MADTKFGCEHYKRKCAFISPCCKKVYVCRLCHDNKESHAINRHAVQYVECLHCQTIQKVSNKCIQCKIQFGGYFCSICRLYDDDGEEKGMFHCSPCGICRRMGKENTFHCSRCDMCILIQYKDSHQCVAKASRTNCPVCHEYLHTSRKGLTSYPCGHYIHVDCMDSLIKSGKFHCLACEQSLTEKEDLWKRYDDEIENTPMPDEYMDFYVQIFCNDCLKNSQTLFHVVGLKCRECGSYNTFRIEEEEADTPETASATSGFSVGDNITIKDDFEYVKRLQKGHGGWNDKMRQLVKQIGSVKLIDQGGDLKVEFEEKTWILNPDVCQKQEARQPTPPPQPDKNANVDAQQSPEDIDQLTIDSMFKIGDQVRIIQDTHTVKFRQRGHGGWSDNLKQAMSLVGTVVELLDDGDIKVYFGGNILTVNPEICYKPEEASGIDTTKDTSEVPDSSPREQGFNVDDQVKIAVSSERLKVLQMGHGGFQPRMKEAIGPIGLVTNVDSNGDLSVKFPQGIFVLNPAACITLNPTKVKMTGTKYSSSDQDSDTPSTPETSSATHTRPSSDPKFQCQICWTEDICVFFNCGHAACETCSKKINECHMCRLPIIQRTKFFV